MYQFSPAHILRNKALSIAALLLGLLAPWSAFSADAPAQSEGDYTEAQNLLFKTPHLDNIDATSQLHYTLKQSGSLAHKIDDEIVLSITAIHADKSKDITPRFLSGKREKKFPGVEKFRGNALLLYFLEWDIEKMHSNRTMNMGEIHQQYFQHVIRNGFHEAKVTDSKVTYNGKELPARRVIMQPLAPMKGNPKYLHMWNKRYEFVLADVPGGIYRISTRILSDKPRQPPKERTVITFSRVAPAAEADAVNKAAKDEPAGE